MRRDTQEQVPYMLWIQSQYYHMIETNIRDRFNLKLVRVLADGNCFFRSLSHIIFGDESKHYNVRILLLALHVKVRGKVQRCPKCSLHSICEIEK